MERGRLRVGSAAWGGVSLGVGTLTFALCSPSNAGCSTNLIVLTHGSVTARGCAAFSVAARIGVGMMVLGAVLLLGSFIVTIRARRQVAAVAMAAETASALPIEPEATAPTETPTEVVSPLSTTVEEVVPKRRTAERVGPIPPGQYGPEYEPEWHVATPEVATTLPPGWYGNPNNPDSPVQWWDGNRLTEPPSRPGR
jgi:hypothetical protein